MAIERRFFDKMELRAEGDGAAPSIVGYGAMFNVLSEDLGGFREAIQPGFFDKVLGNDTRSLFNHDVNQVLGRTVSKTLTLEVDEQGLSFRALPPDTQYARDLGVLLKRGDVTQTSFGFDVAVDRWEMLPDGEIIRYLVECERLYDVGPVTFPAYPQTSVQMRSLMNVPEVPAELRGATGKAGEGEDQGRPEVWQERLGMLKRRLSLAEVG